MSAPTHSSASTTNTTPPAKLPFSDYCIVELVHGPRSVPATTAVKFAKAACPRIGEFKKEYLEKTATHYIYLHDQLGTLPSEWITTVPRIVQICIELNQEGRSSSSSRTDESLATLVLNIVGSVRIPRDAGGNTQYEMQWRYGIAYKLVVTAILDLQQNPVDGFFIKQLGGPRIEKWEEKVESDDSDIDKTDDEANKSEAGEANIEGPQTNCPAAYHPPWHPANIATLTARIDHLEVRCHTLEAEKESTDNAIKAGMKESMSRVREDASEDIANDMADDIDARFRNVEDRVNNVEARCDDFEGVAAEVFKKRMNAYLKGKMTDLYETDVKDEVVNDLKHVIMKKMEEELMPALIQKLEQMMKNK